MSGKKDFHPFGWLSYLFHEEGQEGSGGRQDAEKAAVSQDAGSADIGKDAAQGADSKDESDAADGGSTGDAPDAGRESGKRDFASEKKRAGKRRRRGIDDEDPVSFRTATEPLSVQQMVYYCIRDLLYAAGPMFSYILITLACIIVGYPLSGMMRYSFAEYLADRSNLLVAIGVVLTLRRLHRKSKKSGSTFFEDAALYRSAISWKKIGMGLVFGTGAALFLSALLTFIPKVWVFAIYEEKVSRIYQRYDILLTIVESAVLTPLVEEIIFRGYMLNRLLRRWADLPALIVTTIIFSVMHGSSVWFLYAFVMGWIIGRISMWEGNILYGIFVHAGFNLPSVVQWFIWFLHPERQSLGRATDIFQTFLAGTVGLVLALLMALLYKREREKGVLDG